jgi:hypothetical protein
VGTNDGDVDRAMAAFTASPMPYYNFTASAAPSSTARVSGSDVAPAHPVRSASASAFPLLLAALPEIGQASMPIPPPGANTVSGNSAITSFEATKVQSTTRPVLDRPLTQPGNIVSNKTYNGGSGLPVRYAQAAKPASQPVPVQRDAASGSTPIATMFHALHTASPPHHGSTETKTELQEILSRL